MSEIAAPAGRIEAFVAAISSSVDSAGIERGGLAALAVDGIEPALAVAPTSMDALSATLAAADRSGIALIPRGGGAHMAFGNLPTRYDAALSLAQLDGIVEHEPADLTVTVQAGMRLAALQQALAERGQFLPLDPPGGSATVGGVLAANAHGALRHAFGTARDWLIGLRVAGADGTITRSGGRVVKNVAGYDLNKLHIGALGTLGVIAEATFKLAPLPKAQRTLALSFDSSHGAATLAFAARDAGLALHACELLSPRAADVLGEARWSLLLRAAGGAGAVERTLQEITDLAAGLMARRDERDASAWDAWHSTFAQAALSLRISVPPSSVSETIEDLDDLLGPHGGLLSSTVSAGLIRAHVPSIADARAPALIAEARRSAERARGSLVVDAASPAVKRGIDVFGPLRGDFAIMQRLKREFDPRGTLAPGRFAGRL